ncbi:hypothetical protein ElyMa_003843600 [Elysia marginata]|uniref:Uncharacterized protein n=1 Tax=Elysia marginata TaxID=1093978 RepID=A0AAV4FJI2_9GAST|nr:hypothetical protein ElyMa_003843600 [Elysia marginata]
MDHSTSLREHHGQPSGPSASRQSGLSELSPVVRGWSFSQLPQERACEMRRQRFGQSKGRMDRLWINFGDHQTPANAQSFSVYRTLAKSSKPVSEKMARSTFVYAHGKNLALRSGKRQVRMLNELSL